MERHLLDRVAAVEAENVSLRKALQNARDNASSGEDASYERLVRKYEDLSKAHRTLQEKHARCRPFIERANEKYRAAKDSARQWQRFYDHQQKKAKGFCEASAAVNRASSPVLDAPDLERTPRPLHSGKELDSENDPVAQLPPVEEFEDFNADLKSANVPPDIDEALPQEPTLAEKAGQDQSCQGGKTLDDRAQRVTSSQTTDIGSDPAPLLGGRATSDDEPEFVSARPVKRRRGNSPRTMKASTQIKKEPTTQNQPLEIHSGDYSSPVLTRRRPVRVETSNLDVMPSNLQTPSGRRGARAASAEVQRPPIMPVMQSSLSEGHSSDALPEVKAESEQCVMPADSRESFHPLLLPPEGSDGGERALQPLSANITRPSRPSVVSAAKRKRKDEESRAKAAMVSEDGDMDSSQAHPQGAKKASNAAVGRRLDSLLDEPTPGRNQIAARATPNMNRLRRSRQDVQRHSAEATTRSRSPRKKQPLETSPAFKTPTALAKPPATTPARTNGKPSLEASPPPPDPEDEPLRSRPVIRLRMEDFKVNPKYKGTDFAFADTLRGRDQRRCLPGCTKPECCGDAFRKAAEMGVKGSTTDDDALANYLGPAWETHMASRTPAERRDVMIQARAYAIASEYGKHRSAFKRRTTPPGFWRTDFPSTQETEQDRLKAHEMMRQEVYDRWREAMQPGGRWKFRDE